MKLQSIILFTMLAVLAACGKKDERNFDQLLADANLEDLRAEKSSLSSSQKKLEEKIAILDSVIGSMDTEKKLPLVTTLKSKNEHFEHFVEFQGNVSTKQNILIYPEVPGKLIKVNVKEGQRVSKGQVLASIDDGGLHNQLAQLKTQLALAKTTYERQQSLWDKNIGTEIQLLQVKAQYEAQEEAVKQLQNSIAKYTIRAPFSGIIDDVIKHEGMVVAPGQGSELLRIVNLSNMYIEVEVPESYVPSIKKGNKVMIDFPILGKEIESTVRSTGNFINPNNRSFLVEVSVPNDEGLVKPNMTAKVSIKDYVKEDAILIPQSIISENAEGDQFVYVVNKINKENIGVASRQVISTGKSMLDIIEVVDGLEAGFNLIQEGARSVKDGQEVKILKI